MLMPWQMSVDNIYYAKYANSRHGANTNGRLKWKGFRVIARNEAVQFTTGVFFKGARIQVEGVPVNLSLIK